MRDAVLLLLPVVLPIGGAALAVVLRKTPAASETVSGITIAAMTAAAIALFVRATNGAAIPVTIFGGWPGAVGIGFAARLPGVVLVLVTALVALAIALFGHADIGARKRRAGYDGMMLALLAAVNGAFLTTDLFNLYVWFELALVAALGLLTLDRTPRQIGGAIRYAAFGMTGATALLIGIGLLYGSVGTLDLTALATTLAARPPTLATASAVALLLAGFALKSGLVPLHFWLPASYPTAPLAVAALLSGLLTKMGFYALLLVAVGVFGVGTAGRGAAPLLPVLGVIAGATMLLCSLTALGQSDMRRLLSYHVIGQVGYMAMGLSVGTSDGVASAISYMVHSILVQANLFLGAGAIRRATGSWTLTHAGGMIRSNPLFAFLFAVPMLSLAGIPPLSGFWAKVVVIRAALDGGMPWLALAALVAAMLTVVSVATFWSEACWKDPRGRRIRKVPPAMLAAMATLSLATLAIGLNPERMWVVAQMSSQALATLGASAP